MANTLYHLTNSFKWNEPQALLVNSIALNKHEIISPSMRDTSYVMVIDYLQEARLRVRPGQSLSTRSDEDTNALTILSLRYTYRQRIAELRDLTMGEDFSLSQKSERYFWDFFQTLRPVREAELAIISDGTLSAIWDGNNGDYVGVEFLNDGKLLYTIFKGEMDSADRICEADYGHIKDVESRIRHYNLDTLLRI